MAIPPEDREIRVDAGLWQLEANPGRIEAAAAAWRRLAKAGTTIGDDIDGDTKKLLGSQWAGKARDSFAAHQGKVIASLDGASTHGDKLAVQLDAIADLLRRGQSALDTEREKITKAVHNFRSGGDIVFRWNTTEQATAVGNAASHAKTLRKELDDALTQKLSGFATADWDAISTEWGSVASGATDPFTLPAEATNGVSVIMVDGQAVVNTGPGDDNVKVTKDPDTGQVIVEVNGQKYYYPPGTPVTIRAGEGNDRIEVPKGANLSITMLGGRGDDEIRGGDGDETIVGLHGSDQVYAGAGNDYVSTGSGRDYADGQGGDDILSGGLGNDVVYGLSGNDKISGGEGDDYLEGATGDDVVHGGAGKDVVSGGRDNDRLDGGTGDDVFYGGHGRDTIAGSGGNDTAYRQDEDSVSGVRQDVKVEVSNSATYIQIKGSPEFQERVQADLDMMRASPIGQKMLAELDDIHSDTAAIAADWPVLGGISYQGNPLVIEEADSNTASSTTNWHLGEDYKVTYAPGRLSSSDERPPIVGMFHEFAHIYDFGNNTSAEGDHEGPTDVGVPNDEREAVGLPIDEDDDPNTPGTIDPDHPYDYTENRFREELGWPTRKSYS
ncbi:MAG TPA: calcium-binding protein [Micromonosporaceae bacterium]|nr:calcium-binding protein [Micromonosporaceae bacterium]HCU49250.1 calcium-binding protein [Micromonosporaceae bacterium]